VSSPRRAALLLVAVLLAALTACSGGGSSSGSGESATQLLARAKQTLDAAPTVHFVLSSTGAPATGTLLTGGEGDIERPASFQGSLKVQVSGAGVDLKVVSVNGTVYAQLPFASGYSVVDPATFGFGDPGALLDPQTGISQLLTAVQSPKLGPEKRVNGEVVREVDGDLPGSLVQKLLTSKDPAKPVHARFSVATGSGQLRQVVLTGPFFVATADGTYTLQLSKFGADVSITAPPTS
jgi:LppX_LprAFG lipoprotein